MYVHCTCIQNINVTFTFVFVTFVLLCVHIFTTLGGVYNDLTLFRYTILAPKAIPAGFVDGMKATEKLVEALNLEENEFRMGYSKVIITFNLYTNLLSQNIDIHKSKSQDEML